MGPSPLAPLEIKRQREWGEIQGHLLSSASMNVTSACFWPLLVVSSLLFRKINSSNSREMLSALWAVSQQGRGENSSQGLGLGSLGAWPAPAGE